LLVVRKEHRYSPSICVYFLSFSTYITIDRENVKQTTLDKTISAVVDERMNRRKQNSGAGCIVITRSRDQDDVQRRSRQTTRPISAACCRHQMKCTDVAPQARIAALSGRELSPDREVTTLTKPMYTIYSGGSASEELSQQPQFSLKNELNIACKSHSYLHQV